MALLTSSLPGTGGLIKAVPEDFVVEELPAYPASGDGTHTFLLVEKRALTTEEALGRLCAALGVRREEAGVAGNKDRQAVTRQWVSLPGVDPERALSALGLERALAVACEEGSSWVRVLEARRHPHKLRTGHLAGNRFILTVRGTTDGLARAGAVLAALGKRGLPNRFGSQRFGNRGDNAARGRALLDGTHRGRLGRTERRLLISAIQADLFNRYLATRMERGILSTVLEGDVLKKTDTGGLFTASAPELAEAQARCDAGAVVVTGPMFGHKMMAPPPGSGAAALEQELLEAAGLDRAAFATLGKLGEGTRRPLLVPIGDPSVRAGDEAAAIVLTFALPPGAYATVLLEEVMKAPEQPA